ncbi:MAG: FAD-dependent oxidoreductase, partial [Terriglobales bacterium]
SNCCSSCPRILPSYQVVLWKQERFVVLRPLQIEFFRSLLGSPIENTLFFAGEATDTTGHNGTVHGAIASGRRAAQEILLGFR